MLVAVGCLADAAAAQITFCGPSPRECARLSVPLDRSGAQPGEVTLAVERREAKAPPDPPLFLLAGGPGQSAVRAYPNRVVRELLGKVATRRDVVVFDQRGTGDSGVLRCPGLEAADADADLGAAAAACAGELGTTRAFYTTDDSVADLDAVRAALGYDKLALLGTSYGTLLALRYAAAHPEHVDRLILDSTVEPAGVDPLLRPTLAATGRVLRELCRHRCDGITPDPVGDLQMMVRRLVDGPVRGLVYGPGGRPRRVALTRSDLLDALLVGDVVQGFRERLPAALRSAVRGDTAPLLRLIRLTQAGAPPEPRDVSVATFAATTCEETPLPWGRGLAPDARRASAAAVVAAQPAAVFAPFDAATALASDVLRLCVPWPDPERAAPAAPALPDVPVLVLSGTQDARTPIEGARRVAALFPRSTVVTSRGSGHSVLGSALGDCPARAVRRFLTSRRAARRCRTADPVPRRLDPVSVAQIEPRGRNRGRSGRTIEVVRRTYADALQVYFELATSGERGTVREGGLRGGHARFSAHHAVLRRLVYVPGVRVSGRLRSIDILPTGVFRVRGPAAVRGTVRVRAGTMRGRLGGHSVRAILPDLFDLELDFAFKNMPSLFTVAERRAALARRPRASAAGARLPLTLPG